MVTAIGLSNASPVPDKQKLSREEFFNQPEGFPFGDFNPDDVVLPPGDDLGVASGDDDAGVDGLIDAETGFSTSIALDGLPVVRKEKFDKLTTLLLSRFRAHGEVKEGCFWMPTDDGGCTKGCAFIEFSRREEASKAVKEMDGYRLDKSHVIRVFLVDDLDRLELVAAEYAVPPAVPFDADKHRGTLEWMMDRRGRDQFVIQYDRQHKVCWNDAKKGCAEVFFEKSAPTEWSPLPLTFSPLGTYICSLHPPLGAALWVSRSNGTFERVMRFPSAHVQKADFSAHEEYITLYSVVQNRSGAPDIAMAVFDVRSGRKLRVLQESLPTLLVGYMKVNADCINVPFLMWSPAKPALLARVAANALYVYLGCDMTLMDKKPLALEGIQDARWSPTDNLIAVYQEEHNNLPARVSIISLPDKTELRAKSLFSVHEVHMYWQEQGKYLAVHVAKHTKSRKTTYATIELFTLKSSAQVINDVLELPSKGDKVLQIAWEPRGHRFAVIHGELAPGQKQSVSFYTMVDKTMKQGAKLLGTISNRNVSELHWSPAGRNILLAGLSGTQGSLEFFNVDDMATLRLQAHFMCNNVRWDRSGRFVCSWVDVTRDMDHGYVIWSFTGEMLYRESHEGLWHFSWRPRPPSLLPLEKERDIVKNLKVYAKKYEEDDELLLAAAGSEQLERRANLRKAWEEWAAGKEQWLLKQSNHFVEAASDRPLATAKRPNQQPGPSQRHPKTARPEADPPRREDAALSSEHVKEFEAMAQWDDERLLQRFGRCGRCAWEMRDGKHAKGHTCDPEKRNARAKGIRNTLAFGRDPHMPKSALKLGRSRVAFSSS